MRRTGAALAAALVGAVLAVAGAAPGAAGPTDGVATVQAVRSTTSYDAFPVLDATGKVTGEQTWRLTDAGGNCCEVYVASTPSGQLLELGGGYPMVSDDRGVTWREVRSPTIQLGGEGTITAAPNGDIVGMSWHAYSGDHVVTFKYTAATKQWTFREFVPHHPVYDRPWISVVPGPVTAPDGTVAPYATVMRSNYLSALYDLFYVSYDGLMYVPTSSEVAPASAATTGYLEPAAVPVMDYLQPHAMMRVTPLSRGGLLNAVPARTTISESTACPTARLRTDSTWECLVVPSNDFDGSLHVDSRGWLHEVVQITTRLYRYGVSPDGGRTWQRTDLLIPAGGTIPNQMLMDFKVNGALGVAAVAMHPTIAGASQDVVFKLDVTTPTPRLVKTMYVGDGNLATVVGGQDGTPRFDFGSVALLPDGAVALAFFDARSDEPMLAVEAPEAAPPAEEPTTVPPTTEPPPTTVPPTTVPPTTEPPPTTVPPTTVPPTTEPPPTSVPPTTEPPPTSVPPTSGPPPTTVPPTTEPPPTTVPPTSPDPTPPPGDTTPPAVTVQVPAGLTDPTVVRFDEPVTGVTAENVALTRGGTPVATARRCRDGAGVTAPCGGLVTEVELTTSLRPGERYAVVVNPAGPPPVRDAAGNAAIATVLPFRASTSEPEHSAAATYAWPVVREPAAYGGSYHAERLAGAALSYAFSGTSVTWYAGTGPAHGRVQVLVDGADRGTVDTYSAGARWRVPFTVAGLAPGPHTLTLRVRGDRSARSSGTRVAIDAVDAGTLVATPAWRAAWRRVAAAGFADRVAAVADTRGAQVSFIFRGTGVAWLTALAPNAGRAVVYVDGDLHAVVDNYAATRRYGVRRWVGGLADGVHRVTVRVAGTRRSASTGTAVVVDGWLVR